MNYGLYLSAMGVLTNTRRQDVIANNLANTETVGFKRDLVSFVEQRTESARRNSSPPEGSQMLEGVGGGLGGIIGRVDLTQGEIEHTGNATDVAIFGQGYFAVRAQGQTMLTRDGRFMVGRDGTLIRSIDGARVLDQQHLPIAVNGGPVRIGPDGTVKAGEKIAGKIGLFDVNDPSKLSKRGGGLFAYADGDRGWKAADVRLEVSAMERSNAEPASELAALMETHRQLEANANMIRLQDQTLAKLVNEVGKI